MLHCLDRKKDEFYRGHSVAISYKNLFVLKLILNLSYVTQLFKFYIVLMITENVLDDTHPENVQFANCKIKYLLTENKMMTLQLGSITTLITKYKKVIDLLSKNQDQLPSIKTTVKQTQGLHEDSISPEIGQILKQAENIIQGCIEQCKQVSQNANLFDNDQGTITPAFFAELVLSYQKSIHQLKQSIHQREILLQELQTTPNHPMKRPKDQSQSSAIIKAIQSYDIYPKISEKCRKQILELKQKKKQFQSMNSARSRNSTVLKQINENMAQIDKTIKKGQMGSNELYQQKNVIETEKMSPFEKTILIYKKKKIFNDILESRVIDLKKKIQEKEQVNQILRKKLESEVWENLQHFENLGRNLQDEDPTYLSILNQSIKANNLDFSVDISKIVHGAATKNEILTNLENILEQVQK